MVSSKPLTLVGTGIALGAVHVLTGPDHLSALAALSANVPYYESFWLGVRWGVGHSTGLVVVATIFLLVAIRNYHGDHNNVEFPERISTIFDTLVGVFMICLGLYGVQRARQKLSAPSSLPREGHHRNIHSYYHSHGSVVVDDDQQLAGRPARGSGDEENTEDSVHEGTYDEQQSKVDDKKDDGADDDGKKTTPAGEPEGQGDTSNNSLSQQTEHDDSLVIVTSTNEAEASTSQNDDETDSNKNEENNDQQGGVCAWWNRLVQRVPVRTMAFLAGIVHGLSGPGGVLGVIPAVQLRDPKLSALYLACFCISSTLTMGCYATFYGLCSTRLAAAGCCKNSNVKFDFVIECVSAVLALTVGILWLLLLSLGLLDDVFP